jgi:hypothetical protein
MEIGGPLVTLLLLTVFAVMAFFAGQAVVNAGIRAKRSSYAGIVTDAFGPTAGLFAEFLLSAALLVAAISYIVGTLMGALLALYRFVSMNHRAFPSSDLCLDVPPFNVLLGCACGHAAQAFPTSCLKLSVSPPQSAATPAVRYWFTASNQAGYNSTSDRICSTLHASTTI